MTNKEVWETRPFDTEEAAWRSITKDYGNSNRLLANMRKAGLTIKFSVRKKKGSTKFFIVMTISGR